MEQVLPEGVENVRDLPYRWFEALRMAMVFLGFEELAKDERPPRKIWLQPDKLEAWFKEVEKERERKYGGKGNKDPGPIEDPVENPAAKALISG